MNLPVNKPSLYQRQGKRFPHLFFLFLLSVIVASLFLLLSSVKAGAQTVSTLLVAPSRQELIVNPGEKTALNVKFYNQADTPVSGPLKVADFVVEDKEGSPILLETEAPVITGLTQISSRYSAASWVALPYDRMTVGAKSKVEVQAKISVPKNAAAGGRYVAIFFEPGGAAGEEGGLITEGATPVSARIAALVYLRVAGPIKESARLVRLVAPKFLEYGPISVNSEIVNLGNYHIRPRGQIILTNTFGQIVDRQLISEQNIFPEVSRLYENKLGERWMLGKYQVRLLAAYGETGKALEGITYVWIIPWRVITAVVLAALIILLLVVGFYRRTLKHEEELEEQIEDLKEKLKEKE